VRSSTHPGPGSAPCSVTRLEVAHHGSSVFEARIRTAGEALARTPRAASLTGRRFRRPRPYAGIRRPGHRGPVCSSRGSHQAEVEDDPPGPPTAHQGVHGAASPPPPPLRGGPAEPVEPTSGPALISDGTPSQPAAPRPSSESPQTTQLVPGTPTKSRATGSPRILSRDSAVDSPTGPPGQARIYRGEASPSPNPVRIQGPAASSGASHSYAERLGRSRRGRGRGRAEQLDPAAAGLSRD